MPVIFVECIAGPDGKLLPGRRALRFLTGFSATDNPTASLTGNGSAVTGVTDVAVNPVTMAAALAGIDLEVTSLLVDGAMTVDGDSAIGTPGTSANAIKGDSALLFAGATPPVQPHTGQMLLAGDVSVTASVSGHVAWSATTSGGVAKLGLYGGPPVAQQTRPGQLTDSSTGTPSSTIADVGAAFSQVGLNNIHASFAQRINALETLLHNLSAST